MEWRQFMDKLLKDFRTSPYRLNKEYGISQVAIHQVLTGKTKKPQQRTIGKLEAALGIKIDDKDPSNLRYSIPNDGSGNITKRKFHTHKLKGRFDNVDIRESAYD